MKGECITIKCHTFSFDKKINDAIKASQSKLRPISDNYCFRAFIATQNDKMRTAIEAFDDIINNMPDSGGCHCHICYNALYSSR